MSSSGWVNNVSEKADTLMAYFFESEYSQSNIYAGKVVSCQQLIQSFGHNPMDLQIRTRETLDKYLAPFFDSVNAEVDTDMPHPEYPNRVHLKIKVSVIENAVRYDLGHLIEIANSKIIRFINLNEEGIP